MFLHPFPPPPPPPVWLRKAGGVGGHTKCLIKSDSYPTACDLNQPFKNHFPPPLKQVISQQLSSRDLKMHHFAGNMLLLLCDHLSLQC